jgi:hypothetical protein
MRPTWTAIGSTSHVGSNRQPDPADPELDLVGYYCCFGLPHQLVPTRRVGQLDLLAEDARAYGPA